MGADNGMDAQDNAWAQLGRRLEKTERAVREMRDERDEAYWIIEEWKKTAHAVMDERDALAAHVERLRNLLKHPRPDENLVHNAIIETPSTSLARRDADEAWSVRSWAKRHQAKGDTP